MFVGCGSGDVKVRFRPIADANPVCHVIAVKPLPPTNAQLRVLYAPVRTWIVMCGLGLLMSLVRDVVYDVPFVPIRLVPFWICLTLSTLYAGTVLGWLAARRLYVR